MRNGQNKLDVQKTKTAKKTLNQLIIHCYLTLNKLFSAQLNNQLQRVVLPCDFFRCQSLKFTF